MRVCGMTLANRVRLLLETASDVRAQWPQELPLLRRHALPDAPIMKETQDWLDRYLGPVRTH